MSISVQQTYLRKQLCIGKSRYTSTRCGLAKNSKSDIFIQLNIGTQMTEYRNVRARLNAPDFKSLSNRHNCNCCRTKTMKRVLLVMDFLGCPWIIWNRFMVAFITFRPGNVHYSASQRGSVSQSDSQLASQPALCFQMIPDCSTAAKCISEFIMVLMSK